MATVHLFSTSITTNTAPFDRYRDLGYNALARMDFDLPGSGTILLKANATVLFPADKRVVTHPGFLAGLADALIERGVAPERIVVGDGQSGEQPDKDHTWQGAGYTEMVESRGIRLTAMNETETKSTSIPGGVVYDTLPIYREVTDCALFFNIPIAKCHNLGCTTLTIKNLMGILGRPERHLCAIQEVDKAHEDGIWRLTGSGFSRFEDRFYHKLCDTLSAFRSLGVPRLCAVDGLIGRDGTAFNEGDNYPLGWTVIGDDEVAVDTVATWLMGLDPEQTPYLNFAADRGLGSNAMSDHEVIDLATGAPMNEDALRSVRSKRVLMPISRGAGGYYNRFNRDGSPAPWRIDAVNEQRAEDGLEPIAVDRAASS